MISLLRVDDRLIHGMVAVSWNNAIRPDAILVANDKAGNDSFMQMTLKLAKPPGVALGIKTIDEAIVSLKSEKLINKKILVITDSVVDALKLSKNVELSKVNVGICNVKQLSDMKQVLPNVFMSNEDYQAALELDTMGVEVFAQGVPTTTKLPFDEIKKIFSK